MMRLMLRITHFFLPFFPRFAKMEIKETRKGGLSMAAKKIDLEEIAALTKALFHAHYAGDLDKWFSYLCPDSVYLGTGEPLLFGGDAIREHFKTVLNQALRKAAREKLLPVNPFAVLDKDLKPKHVRYIPQTYDENDLRKMFAAMRGDPMALIILMDVTYGLRRSELLGLKWSAINFKEKSIHICYKVTETLIDGKLVYVKDSLLKNKSSNRTLPLVPSIEEELLRLKFQQNRNRKLYGKAYEQDDRDFVFVNECGKLIKPDYVSRHFQWFLKKNNLKKIRFHDLRHTCATMLCRKKISLQEIQVWLGHSTYQTTADIYTHLNYTDKIGTANAAARIVSDVLGKGGSE